LFQYGKDYVVRGKEIWYTPQKKLIGEAPNKRVAQLWAAGFNESNYQAKRAEAAMRNK